MEWQPIETAPRDGTEILVTSEYGDVSVVRWLHNDWQGMCDGEPSIAAQGDTYTDYHHPFCSHWMPLPEPPKEGDG